MPSVEVGIREFRANLSRILESKDPVTITRHGQTLGLSVLADYRIVPSSRRPTKAILEAARRAGEEMDATLAAVGTTAEEVIADYERTRRQIRSRRGPP